MLRETRTQLIAGIAALACLAGSAYLSVKMTTIAGRARMTATDRVEESASWEVSAGIAMGAFRGLFVNMLWIRANDMKEEGKFHEAVELASAITKLQPRFPRVGVFHAWNLAYNISVATQTSAERWDWVNQGIRILRDKGIPANPNDMLLHKELSWIFNHKIAGYTDDANGYYKRRFAAEWTVVLGPPPKSGPEMRDRNKAIDAYANWLQQLVDAPGSVDELVKANPEVGTLLKRLGDEANITDLGMTLLDRYEIFQCVRTSSRRKLWESDPNFDRQNYFRALGALVEDPAFADAWPPLLNFVRSKVLREKYHMSPSDMVRFTRKYGPMDWRHPSAHTVYWAQKGVEGGLSRVDEENKRDYDFINTDRMVAQGVQELFRSGELYFDFLATRTRLDAPEGAEAPPTWQGMPNVHFAATYGEILEELSSRSWADNRLDRGFRPYVNGYENFLRDVICFHYRRGERARAEEWRTRLRTMPGRNVHDPGWIAEEMLPLDEWVQRELNDRFTSPYVAMAQISGALLSAYASGLLAGDDELFLAQFRYAALAHRFYMEEQLRGNVINRETMRMEQFERNFQLMAANTFFQFLMTLDADDAERVYNGAPDDLKGWVYDPLANQYQAMMDEAASKDLARPFDRVFPPPPNLDECRAERARIAAERAAATPRAVESK
ncbi:MAG: hypothetical protein ACK54H_01090 [Phycisphaerales bacterium]